MNKKRGSALLLSLFVLTLVSMFLLASFQRVKSRNIDLVDNLQMSRERNIRDNGIRILKYELKKLKSVRDDGGIYFKPNSKFFQDGIENNKPKEINIKEVNYKRINYNNGRRLSPPLIIPKSDKYYSGIEINSNYDYIGKTLKILNRDKYAFKINSLYLRNGSLTDHIEKNTDVSEYHSSSWARQEEDFPNDRTKVICSEDLLEEVKNTGKNDGRSFAGYKLEKIEIENRKINLSTYKDENDKNNNCYKGKKAKITFEKKIILTDKLSGGEKETFSIEMSFEGTMKDNNVFDPNDVANDRLIQEAKITKIDN